MGGGAQRTSTIGCCTDPELTGDPLLTSGSDERRVWTLRAGRARPNAPKDRPNNHDAHPRWRRAPGSGGASEGRLVDIVEQGFDAGVRLMETVPKDMIAVAIGGQLRFLVVASPTYLAGREPPTMPGALTLGFAYVPESFARTLLDAGRLMTCSKTGAPGFQGSPCIIRVTPRSERARADGALRSLGAELADELGVLRQRGLVDATRPRAARAHVEALDAVGEVAVLAEHDLAGSGITRGAGRAARRADRRRRVRIHVGGRVGAAFTVARTSHAERGGNGDEEQCSVTREAQRHHEHC
jgi:hypothetical protein